MAFDSYPIYSELHIPSAGQNQQHQRPHVPTNGTDRKPLLFIYLDVYVSPHVIEIVLTEILTSYRNNFSKKISNIEFLYIPLIMCVSFV